MSHLDYFSLTESDSCSNSTSNFNGITKYQCTEAIKLSETNAYIYLIGTPISILSSLIFIIGFIKYEHLRRRPGDLIFGISISNFLLSSQWFLTALSPDNINKGSN